MECDRNIITGEVEQILRHITNFLTPTFFLNHPAHDYILELHNKVLDKDETIRQLREELAAMKKSNSSVNDVSQESSSENENEGHRAEDEDTVMEVDQESNASEGHDESDG